MPPFRGSSATRRDLSSARCRMPRCILSPSSHVLTETGFGGLAAGRQSTSGVKIYQLPWTSLLSHESSLAHAMPFALQL